MTAEEYAEYNYVYLERIGMLCGTGEPTFEQIEMAKKDADEAVERMRHEQNL